MSPARKFWFLSSRDRELLVLAALAVAAARLGLRFVPLRSLARVLQRLLPAGRRAPHGRIAWAVDVAARSLRTAGPCLPSALAAHAILRRQGAPARLVLGVAKAGDANIDGHAWVECGGRTVLGGDVSEFVPLAVIE